MTTDPLLPTRDQLLAGARAAVAEIPTALGDLSAQQLAARLEHLVTIVRRHGERLLAETRTMAGQAASIAEGLVAERLGARIKAKVAPPIAAALVIALAALLVSLLALRRTRGRT